jgi:hypothetical protein
MESNRALISALRADRDVAARAPYAWQLRRDVPEDLLLKRVWADVLLERGDARGEQLALELAVENGSGEGWCENAERLLARVCEVGFVCVPDDPDAALMNWSNRTRPYFDASTLSTVYEGAQYTLRYWDGELRLLQGSRLVFIETVALEWSDGEINLVLHAASEAIRRGMPTKLKLPDGSDPRCRPGPCPRYRVPRGGTVAARDISRWNAIYRRLG